MIDGPRSTGYHRKLSSLSRDGVKMPTIIGLCGDRSACKSIINAACGQHPLFVRGSARVRLPAFLFERNIRLLEIPVLRILSSDCLSIDALLIVGSLDNKSFLRSLLRTYELFRLQTEKQPNSELPFSLCGFIEDQEMKRAVSMEVTDRVLDRLKLGNVYREMCRYPFFADQYDQVNQVIMDLVSRVRK